MRNKPSTLPVRLRKLSQDIVKRGVMLKGSFYWNTHASDIDWDNDSSHVTARFTLKNRGLIRENLIGRNNPLFKLLPQRFRNPRDPYRQLVHTFRVLDLDTVKGLAKSDDAVIAFLSGNEEVPYVEAIERLQRDIISSQDPRQRFAEIIKDLASIF